MEERVSSLDAKVDGIGELRADMNRQFSESREDMNRLRFEQVDGWFERLDRRSDRQFMWVVGIQFALFISVIAALLRAATS